MSDLLAQTIPLALGAAISPVLFLLQLATMTRERPLARGLAVVAGAAVPLLILGVLAVALGSTKKVTHSSSDTKAIVDASLGALLLVAGIVQLLRPARKPKPPEDPSGEPAASAGVGRSFGLGIAGMVTNFTTIALYIPAMKFVAVSRVSVADKVVVTAIVFAIVLSLVLVPVVLTALMPRLAGRVLSAIGGWMQAHHKAIAVGVCFGFGAWLAIKGLTAL
jgi:hypothetical protein